MKLNGVEGTQKTCDWISIPGNDIRESEKKSRKKPKESNTFFDHLGTYFSSNMTTLCITSPCLMLSILSRPSMTCPNTVCSPSK